MLMLLSPSKTQDFEDELSFSVHTKPALFKHSIKVAEVLKKKTKAQLKKTLSVSDKLAALNYERYKSFSPRLTTNNSRQALLAFRGDVYQGFELEHYTKSDFTFAQKNLRIISGLYGYLRPLDLIQPYRLEMKTKLPVNGTGDLYDFWTDMVTKELKKDIKGTKSKVVINLASNEYSDAIDRKETSVPIIDIRFKEKNGKSLRTVALYAKRARGDMANWIIKNKVNSIKELKKFRHEKYSYAAGSSSETEFVFTR